MKIVIRKNKIVPLRFGQGNLRVLIGQVQLRQSPLSDNFSGDSAPDLPRPLKSRAGGSNGARRWCFLSFFFVLFIITLIIIVIFFIALLSGSLAGFAASGKPRSRAKILDVQLGELKGKGNDLCSHLKEIYLSG